MIVVTYQSAHLLQKSCEGWFHQRLKKQPNGIEIDARDFGVCLEMSVITVKTASENWFPNVGLQQDMKSNTVQI